MDTLTPVERAIELAGGQTALAFICKCKPQAVQQWKKNNRIPADRVITVEKAAGGLVTRYELRPDIYPADDFGPSAA